MLQSSCIFRCVIVIAVAITSGVVSESAASAEPLPSPSPSQTAAPFFRIPPEESHSATPRPLGIRAVTDASATIVDQSTGGPGQVGPEANGFINGSALAPNTPYDLFSSAPLVPGFAGIGQLVTTATYGFQKFDASVSAGLGYVRGSVTNASYWGESLLPTLNSHLGSQALPYAVAFPRHAGQDDGTAVRASILGGSLATADGALRIRGGWFDVTQSDRFVFVAPVITSFNPAIGFATAESLGNGPPSLSDCQNSSSTLPLHGVDFMGKRGDATLEISNATLPSLPGTSARVTLGSLVFDRGEGTRFSGEVVHVTTGGDPILTTVAYGANPQFSPSPTGVLATSTLRGQRQTIAGIRAAFHVVPRFGLDSTVELGRAWYDADDVVQPGSQKPGGFYHVGLTKVDGRVTASVDFFRMEARYATTILPYGVPENQWSTTFAWPGQWLKSNYQLIDNSALGVNRQGYRVRYYVDKGPLEVHLEYTDLRQIEPETTVTSQQTGFVDGFYLPQLPNAATFGRQRRYGFWAAWHPRFGDLTLDIVDDTLFRPFAARQPEDRVSYEVPQAVVEFSRHVSPSVVASASFGRFGLKGTFTEPIDIAQRVFMTGVELKESPATSLLVNFRRTVFSGLTTAPASNSFPEFNGSSIVIEQRLHL